MREDRMWMYSARFDADRFLTAKFVERVEEILSFAFNHEDGIIVSGGNIRCPCAKCKNLKYLDRDTVTLHLHKMGFVFVYDNWYLHGESYVYEHGSSSAQSPVIFGDFRIFPTIANTSPHPGGDGVGFEFPSRTPEVNSLEDLVRDAGGSNWSQNVSEEPNPQAKRLYDLLAAAQQELYVGCQ